MPFNSPGDKTGPLRYTPSHVYNIADCLGKGATASVYLGRHRSTGVQVAIKVYTSNENAYIEQARLREIELLKAVNHRNIMRLIACEKESESGYNVLVMPYCQSGSVYTLLEQPQNGFGFQEEEFLRFLGDISSGMHYLWQKNIIHRDIKPGNIMKGIEEDGSSVYILTDFGAARELKEDEETFTSIYGTEEYIHPGMFQKAVLRQTGPNQFKSSVDLWSLAVTIYHVATGKLPFQSFGGRNDSRTTFEIMSGRKSGEISGIQKQPGGPVERSRHLPEACYLSKGLRELVEPILAGLFEIDSHKAMTFDQYFAAVNDIINRRKLRVFFAQKSTEMILYLRKTDSYIQLQESISSCTDISADRQILLLAQTQLKDIVELNDQIQTYPKSVQNAQLFLFEKDNYDSHSMVTSNLPPFPSFPADASLSKDAAAGRQCAAVAHFVEWKTEVGMNQQMFLLESKLNLRLYVHSLCNLVNRVIPELDTELDMTKKRIECIHISKQTVQTIMNMLEFLIPDFPNEKELRTAVKQFCTNDVYIEDILQKTNNRCEEIKLYTSVLDRRLKECSTPGSTDHLGCHEEHHCLSKVKHIRQRIETVWNTFAKHKKYGELHPHEEFIHKVEREKLEELCVKILSLYQGHCLPNLNTAHNAVNKQNSILLRHLTRVGKVETNIKCVVDCQAQINNNLNQVEERYKHVSELLQLNIKLVMQSPNNNSKLARKEPREITEEIPSASASLRDEKSSLMLRLMQEMTQMETSRTELDGLLTSNTESLKELKRILESTSHLSQAYISSEKMSVECSDKLDSNSATGCS